MKAQNKGTVAPTSTTTKKKIPAFNTAAPKSAATPLPAVIQKAIGERKS